MKNIKNADIIGNFPRASFNLINTDLKVKNDIIPGKLAIGIGKEFSEVEKIKDEFQVMITINLVGLKDIENIQKSNEDVLPTDDNTFFELDITYKVILKKTEGIINNIKREKLDNDIVLKDFAWFLIYPTIKDSINYILNKVGIPNINIPYDIKTGDVDAD